MPPSGVLTPKGSGTISIRNVLLGDRRPIATIFLLSLVFEVMWFAVQNIGFQCDSPGYIQYAQGLLGGPSPEVTLWARTPGYPVLMILSGMLRPGGSFLSFLGILLVQAAMAVGMPILAYETLKPYRRRVAFFTAMVMIVSLQPFIASKLVMTEQSFKFFTVLLIFLACGAYRAPSPRAWIFGLAGTTIFLALLRPAATLFAVLVFGALLAGRPRLWKMLAGAAASLAGALFIYSLAISLLLPPVGQPNLLFYDLYMTGAASALSPDKGESRRELRQILDAFAQNIPPAWAARFPARPLASGAEDPKAWVDRLYREPNRYNYTVLREAVWQYRVTGSDLALRAKARHVIRQVMLEVYLSEPWRLIATVIRYGTSLPGGGSPQIMFNNIFSWHQVAKFSPDNGPASREFIEAVRSYYADNPAALGAIITPPDKKNFANDVDGFIRERLLGVPNPYVFYEIWTVLERQKDPFRARQLYSEVDREGIAHAPNGRWQAYQVLMEVGAQQLQRFFFGIYWIPEFEFFHNFVQCHQNPAYEPELLSGIRLFNWIKIEPNKVPLGYRNWFDYVFNSLWIVVHLGCTYFTILAAPLVMRTRSRWPVLLSLSIILSHAIPSCFIIYAQVRYVDQVLPVAIMMCGFVVVGLVDEFGRQPGRRVSGGAA